MPSQTTSFGTQVNALLRKNAVYQKRRICLNACIVTMPIIFIVLLYAMQTYIDSLSDNRDNRCGCMCVRCCSVFDERDCRPANETSQCDTASEECKAYNDDICGVIYSDPDQVSYCEIRDPLVWPAVLDIPYTSRRPGRFRPDVVMFTTADDPTVEEELTGRLFPDRDLTPAASSLSGDEILLGEVLAHSGAVLGSPTETELYNYIEPAFVYGGLSLLTTDCSTSNAIESLDLLNEGLQQMSDQVLTFTGFEAVQEGLASCTNVQLRSNTSSEINRYIYCSFKEARCNITAEVYGIPFTESDANRPDEYTQAIDFRDTTTRRLEADVWVKDWDFDEEDDSNNGAPSQKRINRPISMIAEAWIKYATGDEDYSLSLLGIQEIPKPTTRLNLQFSSFAAVLLFTWVLQMLLPVMLVQLVYEKEENLRVMMKMHGLGDAAYWSVNYCYYLVLYVIYIFAFVAVGTIVDFVIFTKNSYGVQIIFLFLFGNVQIAFTFVLSNFFKTSRSCVIFSFLWIFGTGFLGTFLFDVLIGRDKFYNYFIELVPAFAAYRGLYEFGEYGFRASYSNTKGLTWGKFDEENNHMGYVMVVLLLEWPFFLLVAWYLEQVHVSGAGVARHPLFFLDYFRNPKPEKASTEIQPLSKTSGKMRRSLSRRSSRTVSMDLDDETIDEENERKRVEGFADEDRSQHSIIIKKLRKVFPAYEGTPEKVAVRSLTMAVQKGEVFGLLGPNGAGKTTTINMLIGFLEATKGTALIEGFDINKDMQSLYGLMGVCPQHNLLWETLTGMEHLLFYGRLKGLTKEELRKSSENALKSVNLFHGGVGNKLVKKYSGGMKRRLSVAISLIGNPNVVYLDEPSTGLDPASRRNLWKVVKAAKQDKAVILTTHNMEEAEVLCDRLGIFVDGKLQFIGNPKNLTSRYGGYLVFTLITVAQSVHEACKLIMEAFPNAKQTYSVGGTLKYEFPSREVSPSHVFHFMEHLSTRIQVLDWGVASVTLEEVFIKIAKEAGAKSNELP